MPHDSPPVSTPPPAWRRLAHVLRGAPAVPPAPRASDYELRQVAARSAHATLYRATERATGRVVAVKTMLLGDGEADRGLRHQLFLGEVQAATRLRHECIVRVLAGGVQGEGDAALGWLAMAWARGADLSRHTTPARLLPEAVVAGIGQRVALALDAAHRAGIVHRDLKPSDVMFNPATGGVKVINFGTARVARATASGSAMMVGTPAYMAPEQLAGAAPTAQSDLYALGVLLFELLTGRRPFESGSTGELLARIAHDAPARLRTLRPELPPLLDDLVALLLEKPPTARPGSAREVARALGQARRQCAAAAPGSAVAAWSDVEPGPDPPPGSAASSAIQGTIAS